MSTAGAGGDFVTDGDAPSAFLDVSTADLRWPDIDVIDFQIIDHLQVDGRASIAGIAKSLGMATASVRQRYERLVARGYVTTLALVDPVILGRQVVAYIEVRVALGITEVARTLAADPDVMWMARGPDFRTLYLQVSTPTHADLLNIVNQRLRPLPEVEDITTSVMLRSWSPVFRFSGSGPRSSPASTPIDTSGDLWRRGATPRTVDDIDRALLLCLERDARMTATAMAAEVGLSLPAARQRLLRLRNDGAVLLRTRPDPLAADIHPVRFEVEISRDSVEVATALTALPNVTYVSEDTGRAGLQLELLCALDIQVDAGYEQISAVPGITAVRATRYREVMVHVGHW